MMRSKKQLISNFSRAHYSETDCLRPDNEKQLSLYLTQNKQESILARGSGLSYNDSCFNTNGLLIDTRRFNHLIDFDSNTGIALCQSATTFADLFLLHPDYIPPVIPGTLHATVAGGIAHDVHGKNNHRAGSFGHHIAWIDLLIKGTIIRCNKEQDHDLFDATIGGLGLTGIITQVALQMKKASRYVAVINQQHHSLDTLIKQMSTLGLKHEYQVAWIDLLHSTPRAILSLADHCDETVKNKETPTYTIPKLPFGLIKRWNMKLFNQCFFNSKRKIETRSLTQFNNPLDQVPQWNRLYGPKGLIQFQAVFDQEQALTLLSQLIKLIKENKATPTLTVLKLFTQSGAGLLSFCKPGFTLAIDFINNNQARQAIAKMNQLIIEHKGSVYLAKDQLLNANQFHNMYPKQDQFSHVLERYDSQMHSDLAKRLGILP